MGRAYACRSESVNRTIYEHPKAPNIIVCLVVARKGGQNWNQKNKKLWRVGACHCKQPVHLYRNNYALCPIKARQIKPGANPEPVVRPHRLDHF